VGKKIEGGKKKNTGCRKKKKAKKQGNSQTVGAVGSEGVSKIVRKKAKDPESRKNRKTHKGRESERGAESTLSVGETVRQGKTKKKKNLGKADIQKHVVRKKKFWWVWKKKVREGATTQAGGNWGKKSLRNSKLKRGGKNSRAK